jgi:hypothetical protein
MLISLGACTNQFAHRFLPEFWYGRNKNSAIWGARGVPCQLLGLYIGPKRRISRVGKQMTDTNRLRPDLFMISAAGDQREWLCILVTVLVKKWLRMAFRRAIAHDYGWWSLGRPDPSSDKISSNEELEMWAKTLGVRYRPLERTRVTFVKA